MLQKVLPTNRSHFKFSRKAHFYTNETYADAFVIYINTPPCLGNLGKLRLLYCHWLKCSLRCQTTLRELVTHHAWHGPSTPTEPVSGGGVWVWGSEAQDPKSGPSSVIHMKLGSLELEDLPHRSLSPSHPHACVEWPGFHGAGGNSRIPCWPRYHSVWHQIPFSPLTEPWANSRTSLFFHCNVREMRIPLS